MCLIIVLFTHLRLSSKAGPGAGGDQQGEVKAGPDVEVVAEDSLAGARQDGLPNTTAVEAEHQLGDTGNLTQLLAFIRRQIDVKLIMDGRVEDYLWQLY